MTLDDILTMIVQSERDDWTKIGVPTFLYEFVHDGPEHRAAHVFRAVYKQNVAVGIAAGLSNPRAESRRYDADWVERFADPEATAEFVDVLYHGNPVDRLVRVVVDGGVAGLPSPRPITEGGASDIQIVGWETTRHDHEFMRAFERLFGSDADNFDLYFGWSGIQIRG